MMTLPALPRATANNSERLQIATPHGSGDARLLAEYASQVKLLVVISASAQEASRIKDEMAFFLPEKNVIQLPDWETLPYDHFSPHSDLISERLAALWQVRQGAADVLVVPLQTVMGVLPPVEFLTGTTFFLKKGEKLDAEKLRADMAFAGYNHVTQVYGPGEFSIRGGLIDLFPMGSTLPFRIDLFDDQIETIRTFDVDTQRSLYPVPEIRLLPAREFPTDDAGKTKFRQRFREVFEGAPTNARLYKDVSNGIIPAGIEYYLPLFFDATATLFDYLPTDGVLALHGDLASAAEQYWQDIADRHKLNIGDKDRPLLPPRDLFLAPDLLFGHLKQYRRIELTQGTSSITQPLPALDVDRRSDNPITKLTDFATHYPGRILLVAESLGRRETMSQFFAEYGFKPELVDNWLDAKDSKQKIQLIAAPIFRGFVWQDEQLAVITEADLYPAVIQSRGKKQQKRSNTDAMLRDLSELKIGDPVVHEAHGIGRYMGLTSMDLGDGDTELLLIEYAGGDKLYVPVSQLHVISRYSGGSTEGVTVHKLGSGTWEKAKRKAAEQVRDTAAELLNLYARRAARQGHAFEWSHHDYQAFAAGFGFEETADQAAAIEAVLIDMRTTQPMDRLVCGDVGFGKTEVALRAAFCAVAGGKQVAVLVPTTLLAEQHYQNFADRFADWPIKVAELSRFRSGKETAAALKGLADGSVDIVIGTHKLVQPDVEFAKLGLVIIDEEHRFGVRQKEQLKALRANVDVLTLTATPIPRTLAMSLEGLRDFSVIATAPNKRLAVKTFVAKFSDGIIREAVLRELKRGGQVFFLHNEVETIENMREKLALLLPEARIGVAHGQMRPTDLEHVMRDFNQMRFNLLLCTTIIENGIDIPNANTILMNRADKFGLSQLHQMRGRVGRSHHQAYAYLLVPDVDGISKDAKKRLEAIQMMEDLGSGFYLAMHDLEIRGAGEVLGDSQSGEMQEIGFALYSQMLKQAVKALKAGKEPDLSQPLGVTTEINLHAPALLPNEYCPDVNERLSLYKRLASVENTDELNDIHQEMIDRFGLLPDATKVLLDCHRLRMLAGPLGISKIDAADNAIIVHFLPKTTVDPMKIISLIQTKKNYKLAGQDKLRIEGNWPESAMRAVRIKELINELH
ncbi:transcription-repair coupling factor [Chitinibacter bivalviorum]|uniref:Transcription-repair-coupling factor n=1 Tax=Chitinibacter bivalviorum TaxID=2739434 RepID=A0A7H9BFI6_9NEIS|nr:transcription-repair coupling factor [Chitinibacter bivalviorum]QLG87470.1 transcription-repair coupling factor [Chitinibacter bivalviorum]